MIPILYFSNYASMTKGGQRSLWYILRDLDTAKYTPVLVCQEEGDLTSLARKAGIPVEILKLPRLRWYSLPGIVRCIMRLRKLVLRYDIRIVHADELVLIILAGLLRSLLKITILWHVRVLWDYPFQKRIGLLFADRIICVSRAVAASFPGSAKIIVVHNGVDPVEFSPGNDALQSDQFRPGDILIGFFAALEPHKGAHVLMEAASYVIPRCPQARFLFAGDGNRAYQASLVQQAQKSGIRSNVIFWGDEKLHSRELMNRMDIIVLPSFTEGLSRTLLEAMSLAKPVIVSDIEPNTELVIDGNTGLVARQNDGRFLAEQILRLLADPSLARQLGLQARDRIQKDFTLQTTMDGITDVYKSMISPVIPS